MVPNCFLATCERQCRYLRMRTRHRQIIEHTARGLDISWGRRVLDVFQGQLKIVKLVPFIQARSACQMEHKPINCVGFIWTEHFQVYGLTKLARLQAGSNSISSPNSVIAGDALHPQKHERVLGLWAKSGHRHYVTSKSEFIDVASRHRVLVWYKRNCVTWLISSVPDTAGRTWRTCDRSGSAPVLFLWTRGSGPACGHGKADLAGTLDEYSQSSNLTEKTYDFLEAAPHVPLYNNEAHGLHFGRPIILHVTPFHTRIDWSHQLTEGVAIGRELRLGCGRGHVTAVTQRREALPEDPICPHTVHTNKQLE
ncbi:hypothetical protein J6590_026874 [Homalodisca vitripennis]|nr:hypothetical protein J6590_026874 [Homalodisca vitripennis]